MVIWTCSEEVVGKQERVCDRGAGGIVSGAGVLPREAEGACGAGSRISWSRIAWNIWVRVRIDRVFEKGVGV